jgi:hypothetical protein
LKTEYQKVEESIFRKESNTPIEVTTIPFEEFLSAVPLRKSSKVDLDFEGRGFALFPSIWLPPNTLFVSWIYTIDLDRELFSVNGIIHFSLSAIPDTWINELIVIYLDGGLLDDDDAVLTPQAIDISYRKLEIDETYVQLYEKADCSILQVEESQFNLNSAYEGLCFELVKIFTEFIRPLFSIISSWGPEDVPFKELAFVIILLADRYSFSLLPSSSPDEEDYDMGVAYPSTTSFWFAGVFIYLTTHLKDDAVRKSAIGHVIELTKGCPRNHFTAFLFSIRELVVIDISEEGVKHTETLPFCDIVSDSDPAVHNVGLLVMIAYFTQSRTSLANHRTRTPTSPSSLPYDILLNIVKYVDWETTITLSATSKLLRECVERLGPKLGNFQLLKYDAHSRDFLACRDGDTFVKIKIEDFDDEFDLSESLFIVKIRYPGVRQQAFIPPLSVNELNSDSESLKVGASVGQGKKSTTRIHHMLYICE